MAEFALDLAMTETAPQPSVNVCMNMIVGTEREPYLAAALESAANLADWAVINLNGKEDDPRFQRNVEDVLDCRFNQEDRLTIIGLPFRNFAFNWNVCLEASRNAKWILYAAADEVWYPTLDGMPIEELLAKADEMEATRIIGTFWHFLKGHEFVHNTGPGDPLYSTQSFLLRMHPDLWIHGTVHEQPSQYRDRDLILDSPGFCHFSYIDPVRVFAKWVRYESDQGRPDFYANYFSDPQAPWRKGPENILDDREGNALSEFGAELPPVMKAWVLDEKFHLHTSECKDHNGEKCCNHDPLVCEPRESIKDKIAKAVKSGDDPAFAMAMASGGAFNLDGEVTSDPV
jgi:hypothetical protein